MAFMHTSNARFARATAGNAAGREEGLAATPGNAGRKEAAARIRFLEHGGDGGTGIPEGEESEDSGYHLFEDALQEVFQEMLMDK